MKNGVFLLARHVAGRPKEIIFEARDDISGNLLWSIPSDWGLNANYGGVQHLAGYFSVGGRNGNDVCLQLLTLDTGTVEVELIIPDVFSAGPLPYSRQSSISTGHGVYYCGRGVGIQVVRSVKQRISLLPFYDEVATQLFIWDGQPGAVVYRDGALSALACDPSSQGQKEWPLPDDPAAIHYTPDLGLVAVAEDGDALMFYPPEGGVPSWRQSGPGWMITNAIATPAGIIAGTDSEAETFLKCFALDDGRELPLPSSWQAARPSPIFSQGSTCWLALPEGLTAFTLYD